MRNRFDTQFLEDDPDVWDTRGSYQGLSPIVYRPIPSIYIYSSTVHSAKGAEEDNVIIINGENSIHGFPNKMQDDPMLKLVLANPESFEYAEERRLFYVALTRTKHRTYILAPTESESVFVTELKDNNSKSLVTRYEMISETKQVKQKCPRCTTGLLVPRKNESTGDLFVGCTNYPQCTNTYKQLSILGDNVQKCHCGGFMVLRTGSRGNFMGCTNYPACTKTMPIPDRRVIYFQT